MGMARRGEASHRPQDAVRMGLCVHAFTASGGVLVMRCEVHGGLALVEPLDFSVQQLTGF
jgi:hypothetical protein